MPTYRVKAPDGAEWEVNAPEGASEADAIAFAQKQAASAPQTPSARRGEDRQARMAQFPPRNFMSSAVHGGLDVAEALAQITSRAGSAIGVPPGTDLPFIASPDIVKERTQQARESVNKALGTPNPDGIDITRALGSAGISAPFMGAVGTAPTMLGRAAQAGRAGAVGGILQPAPNATDNVDFLRQKTFQAGVGGAVGGLAQPAIEMGTNGIQNIANSVLSRLGGAVKSTTDEAAIKIATESLAKQGIAFNSLQDGVKKSLIEDVKKTLSKYGGVNAAALSRQADFKELGIDPLKPWVTRDPVEWGQYKNLEAAKDAGEPLIQARANLDRQLIEKLNGLRGPNTGDAWASGGVAESHLVAHLEKLKSAAETHYNNFRQMAPNVSADGKRLTDELFRQMDSEMVMGSLSGPLKDALNKLALNEIPANPSVLYQLQKMANREARSGGNEGYAAGMVSRAIDRELDRFSNEYTIVGPEMKQAFEELKKARAAHRTLKVQEESIPALKAVAEGNFAAEDFFNNYIKGADVKEVASMWANVDSPRMKQAARSQLVDYLKKAAAGDGSDEAAVFRQAKFMDAVNAPGMKQKMEIVLGMRDTEQVYRVARAAEAAIRTPAGSRYNTSGTAIEMMNLLNRSTGVPFVGPMVTEPLNKMVTGARVSGMSGPANLGNGLLDPFYEEILRKSRRGAGLLSPALGIGTVAQIPQ